MKTTRAASTARRTSIIQNAFRKIASLGQREATITRIMQESSVTHGGFYKHFKNKKDLVGHACRFGFDAELARWRDVLGKEPDYVRRLARHYLSAKHRDNPAEGCPLPTFLSCGDDENAISAPIAEGIRQYLQFLRQFCGDRDVSTTDAENLALLAQLVGAVSLSRSVLPSSPALSKDILEAVETTVTRYRSGMASDR